MLLPGAVEAVRNPIWWGHHATELETIELLQPDGGPLLDNRYGPDNG